MEAAGYTLDVYCDLCEEEGRASPIGKMVGDTFYAQTYAQCKREAKAAGWKWVKRDGKTINLCPQCAAR